MPVKRISCRLISTHAGFSQESALLEEIHKRGMQFPLIAPDLHAGNGLLFFWSHKPIAPWQTAEWLEHAARAATESVSAHD